MTEQTTTAPTTTTAADWPTVAEAVKLGQAVIKDDYDIVITDIVIDRGLCTVTDIKGKQYPCRLDREFTVTWFQPQPTETAPTATEAAATVGGEDFYVKMADDAVKFGQSIVQLKESYEATIAALESRLVAVEGREKALVSALESAYKLAKSALDGNDEIENKVGLNQYAGLLEDRIIQVRQSLRQSLEAAQQAASAVAESEEKQS